MTSNLGTAQALDNGGCPNGIDIAFIMDKSGSVGLRFFFMKNFVGDVIEKVGEGDMSRFGLITFSDEDKVNVSLCMTTCLIFHVNFII